MHFYDCYSIIMLSVISRGALGGVCKWRIAGMLLILLRTQFIKIYRISPSKYLRVCLNYNSPFLHVRVSHILCSFCAQERNTLQEITFVFSHLQMYYTILLWNTNVLILHALKRMIMPNFTFIIRNKLRFY